MSIFNDKTVKKVIFFSAYFFFKQKIAAFVFLFHRKKKSFDLLVKNCNFAFSHLDFSPRSSSDF